MGQQPNPVIAARSLGSTVLVVGNLHSWQRTGRKIPVMTGFHFVSFDDVTLTTLQDIDPDLILSAVVGDDFDAVELARRLAILGYIGRYRALTSGLPDSRIVQNEVAAAAPQIDFALFDLEQDFYK